MKDNTERKYNQAYYYYTYYICNTYYKYVRRYEQFFLTINPKAKNAGVKNKIPPKKETFFPTNLMEWVLVFQVIM